MFGSMVLEVAVGMVFVYLLLSLVLTALTEMVSGALRWRAKDLWQGIRTLLDSGEADVWVRKLYDHPLIQGLSPRTQQDKPAAAPGKASGRGPSYIPSRTFSLALLQILREPREALKREIRRIPDTASLDEAKSRIDAFLSKLPDDPTGLKDALGKEVAQIPGNASTADLKQSLSAMADMPLADLIAEVPNDKLRRSLNALLDESGKDLEALKENIEVWFNNSMTRVSGWYKRRTQAFHMIFGIILAVALNVDTILIIKTLSENPTLRQSVVAQAEAYAKDPKLPAEAQAERFRELRGQIDQLGLPVGWSGKVNPTTLPNRIIGWLLTAFAVSLGAPFWFDMLNKVISIRSSGRAPEEKPKAPKEVPTPLEPGQTPAQAQQAQAVEEKK